MLHSKFKRLADLTPETWYYVRCRYTTAGMFLPHGCGGPVLYLTDSDIPYCVYPIPSDQTQTMKKTYPWTNDESGYPILDTPEKLIAYASAILHEPANPMFINFIPRDLETVELYHGPNKRQVQKLYEKAMSNHYDLSYISETQQIPLGIVNDAAVDSIKHIKKAQDSL